MDKPLTDEQIAEIDAKCREKNEREVREAYLRTKKERWACLHKASVIHPKIGEVIVPCTSQFAAVICACELCHVSFRDIHDAEVWSTD